MKSPANPFDRLTQEEWDFRAITPEQLPYAIIYEYARSCPKVVEHFQAWHQTKLKFDDQKRKMSEAERRSSEETLAKAIKLGAKEEKRRNLAVKDKKHRAAERLCSGDFVKSLMELGDKSEDISFLNGLSVEEALKRAIEERLVLSPAIQSMIFDELDIALPHSEVLCTLNPLFPVPFLKSVDIDSKISGLEKLKPLSPKMTGFRTLDQTQVFIKQHPEHSFSYPWGSKKFIESQNKLGIRKYEFILDLRISKHQIKQEFANWIDQLDDSGIKKFPVKKGKAASLPWFQLKELSAFRLSNARYSYGQAQNSLKEFSPGKSSESSHLLLPIYNSQGSWSDAKARASRRIDEFFAR